MVKEVRMPQLATYELAPYFYLNNANQGVIFSAPVNGKTTPNSQNPRSELRQMSGDQNAAWSNKTQNWSMEAVMAFWQLPGGKPHVVGMQIHDGNDDVSVLRLESNKLYVTRGDDTHTFLVNSNYQLRTFMRVRVTAHKGGGIKWYFNGATTPAATISGVFSGCYFKAGCYTQANPSNGTGQGVTVFKSLKVWKS